ncbi:TPA: serine O-acetyltransferase [Proteus mirabilis]|nr:serine acetyltransferase [Proteus mirabilis]MBI6533177.1 serine acetyltransferase [Proteus mirabilis]HCU0229293.1 serine acetyltransferase [Proteus mirabilis]HEK1164326.1 serine acetyltransferase [Proteus mirabilis]HEK1860703.1 serine acetyltransferase [Proteus mirabilis]
MNHSQIEFLKLCLQKEVIKSDTKGFSWRRTIQRAWKYPERRFYFWWRIASFLYKSNKSIFMANYINRRLRAKYGCDIDVGAEIGVGLSISHYVGLVIAYDTIIGENFHVRQNTTIGILYSGQKGKIHIGNNVTIGANSCIIGDNIKIGNNVMVGAMSFINNNIPDNMVVYTPKISNTLRLSEKDNRKIW